jgi:hypothetical protein
MERIFNLVEAALWFGLSAAVLIGARKATGAAWRNALLAAVGFAVFGISDGIEARTGAWWRPGWLLAMKAACLLLLVAGLRRHRRRSRAER